MIHGVVNIKHDMKQPQYLFNMSATSVYHEVTIC